jgi:hypothetical protein
MATKKQHTGNIASTDLAIKREQNSNALKVKQEAERSHLESKLEKSGLRSTDGAYQNAIYNQTREHERAQDKVKRGE